LFGGTPGQVWARFCVFRGKKGVNGGEGTNLLMDALKRSYLNSLQIASMAVIVDPLDKEAIAFYNHFGFIELPDSGKMFLPMSQLEQIFIS